MNPGPYSAYISGHGTGHNRYRVRASACARMLQREPLTPGRATCPRQTFSSIHSPRTRSMCFRSVARGPGMILLSSSQLCGRQVERTTIEWLQSNGAPSGGVIDTTRALACTSKSVDCFGSHGQSLSLSVMPPPAGFPFLRPRTDGERRRPVALPPHQVHTTSYG